MVVTIIALQRLFNSKDGNPQWRVTTSRGTFDTRKDSDAGQKLSDEWIGREVRILTTTPQIITHLDAV